MEYTVNSTTQQLKRKSETINLELDSKTSQIHYPQVEENVVTHEIWLYYRVGDKFGICETMEPVLNHGMSAKNA
jgi:hypothetical protein